MRAVPFHAPMLTRLNALALCFLALHALARAAGQDAARPAAESVGRHVGTVEDALVGLVVTVSAADGAVSRTRWGNGLVLRCDGYVLAPAGLFSPRIEVAGRQEEGRLTVAVHLAPGTASERRVIARPPRHVPRDTGYAVLKLESVHSPALPTLLMDALAEGDAAQVWFSAYNAESRRFEPPTHTPVRLAPAPKEDAGAGTRAGFQPVLRDVPAGAAVTGPSGMAIGMVRGSGPQAECSTFLTMEDLGLATSCVTPLPRLETEAAAELAETEMVPIPGGPVALPDAVVRDYPEHGGTRMACVAPFRMDRREVTNKEYHAFWLAVTGQTTRNPGTRMDLYPLGWAPVGTPFPETMADMPVLGVPLSGARAYARWAGKRLPTAAEWCLAALGPDGEARPPEWVATYLRERKATWDTAKRLHAEYAAFHVELRQPGALVGGITQLPWIAANPALMPASEWSRRTIEDLLDRLQASWRNPLHVVPVGARAFDVGPYGTQDQLLNCHEMVAPPVPYPVQRSAYYLFARWVPAEPDRSEPFWLRTIDVLTDARGLPLLSRLYRRTLRSPSDEELLLWSSLNEVNLMLRPLAGMRIASDYVLTTDATSWPAGQSPLQRLGMPPGYAPWQALPRHFRREMGRPVPLSEREPFVSSAPPLHYLMPVGFRCAR